MVEETIDLEDCYLLCGLFRIFLHPPFVAEERAVVPDGVPSIAWSF